MKIYTKTGDVGETSLFSGERVKKSNLRVELYGTIDELNSIIGLAHTFGKDDILNEHLLYLNELLFKFGSDLATPPTPKPKHRIERIVAEDVSDLEEKIDEYDAELPKLTRFILPGGSKRAAFLHQARTVCRRAERIAVSIMHEENLGEFAIPFINRLSDYLFEASRYANHLENVEDIVWISRKKNKK